MDWWFVVVYVSLLLVLLGILVSTPEIGSIRRYACALSGDAASIHNYGDIHANSCPFSGDSVEGVPLIGRVALLPSGGITYQWVGR